jgi:hypothetical protein
MVVLARPPDFQRLRVVVVMGFDPALAVRTGHLARALDQLLPTDGLGNNPVSLGPFRIPLCPPLRRRDEAGSAILCLPPEFMIFGLVGGGRRTPRFPLHDATSIECGGMAGSLAL